MARTFKVALAVTATLSLFGYGVRAEVPTTDAVCQTNFGWLNNSLGQSPCLWGAYLEGACGSGYWNVPLLPQGQTYNGPNINQTNVCLCSTVVYNAISACGACQGGSWITWPAWKQQCDQSFLVIGNYKLQIPPGTAVPRWAYQDPTTQLANSFNLTLADAVAGQHLPDITENNQYSAGSPGLTANKKSNVGPIVGGAIGGVIGALLIGVAIWFFMRRHHSTRSSQAPSKMYITKWSKGVHNGPPSRGGGTSYGESIDGDPVKERDGMMYGMQPATYRSGIASPQAPGQYLNHAEIMSSHHPSYPLSSSSPHSSTGKLPSSGHQKVNSGGSSRSKRAFGSPPTANAITPFILPPLEDPVTSPTLIDPMSPGAPVTVTVEYSDGRPSTSSRGAPAPPVLPSMIEYLGDRRPPAATSGNTLNFPTKKAASRSTAARGGAGFYNPDDPSTFPDALTGASSNPSRRPSTELSVGSPSQTYATPGHQGFSNTPPPGAYRATSAAPTTSLSQHSSSNSRSPPPLNMDQSFGGSVHTLPGFTPNTPANATAPHHLSVPQTAPSPAAETAPPSSTRGPMAAIFNTWGRKRRNTGSDLSGPTTNWSPAVQSSDAGTDFDPYRRM